MAAIDLSLLLTKYGYIGVELLKKSIASVRASGETERSLNFDVIQEDNSYTLQLKGREYFKALETGRGPRKKSEYGEFDKKLEEWLRIRGFETKTSKKGIKYYKIGDHWFTAKSLAWKINKEGDSTFRKGGRVLWSDDLDRFVTELELEISKEIAKQILGLNLKTVKSLKVTRVV